MVRWEDFRADIEAVTETKAEERKSNAGRKPYDTILKFKILVLRSLHNLSDESTCRCRSCAFSSGRQDRAHHRHRAGEVQDRDDEPRLQHPSAGSARADGACARLSALAGGVRVS
jgi:hypothetical protein